MKTDDEMYQSVLSRYNDYQQKKKHRIIVTRRIVSLAACFVAIFSGYQIWNMISATPPQIPIIEETTETTFNPVTTTKADTTVTTEKTTETTADTTTATIISDNSTANITQTTAVSSAVQSTAVNTDETVTT
ncbi:MAG: hypothetical protein MJ081_08320, partial [Ruminococcus sp.]|nr:hypothetical protein [Ruminococcus sp.]